MKQIIARFKIEKLFGYQNVDITFDDKIKILIGENGLGKTTILNALYYIIDKKFEKLNEIKFERIELHFTSKKKIAFTHHELSFYLEKPQKYQAGQFYQILSNKLTIQNIDEIKRILNEPKASDIKKREYIVNLLHGLGIKISAPSQFIYDNIRKLISEYEAISFQKNIKIIEEEIKCFILYFPTYRRIESQLKNLNESSKNELLEQFPYLDEEEITQIYNKDLIQFGMDDVKKRIIDLTSEITQKSLIGFSNITGDLLSQLSKEFPDAPQALSKLSKNDNKLRIILDRVGSRISSEDKENIIRYIKSGETSNKGLLFLINKLIELYNQQESLDRAIKDFAQTCNRYLNKKSFYYDESAVTLNIIRNENSEIIDLDMLSSGEKQIVSIFSKIYLEKNSAYIVLFDEPELSLSIFWQQNLLPDIINSQKCNFLLAVTHSPFIYDNDLVNYSKSLETYFINEQ